jgi:hypothetical protein
MRPRISALVFARGHGAVRYDAIVFDVQHGTVKLMRHGDEIAEMQVSRGINGSLTIESLDGYYSVSE